MINLPHTDEEMLLPNKCGMPKKKCNWLWFALVAVGIGFLVYSILK